MIAYLLAAALLCDPALTALFTPVRPRLGRYDVCTTPDPLERVLADPAGVKYGPLEALEPLDAFGQAGQYDRARLARLYRGGRVRVVRGWAKHLDRFEAVTLLSPYPDAALSRLSSGTMIIRWTLSPEPSPVTGDSPAAK